ncbi:MAG TPA: 50S ribosomal protein L22 [Candidatus Hydrogenedentes bacterium]|mgnify:CR=1 FL=1|nr:50S ribosomal protein L22 [Candidatus Hydrogenedentota bacterium]HPG69450.1 50S ribosomal protein L22 [Candidatus Hydrogenedentota bacterium]
MAQAVARARYLKIAPRKLRLLADLIRGKKVDEARNLLEFMPKGGAPLLAKVLKAAVANAEHAATERRERIDTEDMVVQRIWVNEGPTQKRYQAAPRGRAMRVRKRSSHIELWIGDNENG